MGEGVSDVLQTEESNLSLFSKVFDVIARGFIQP
jgi:hypothetical protein